MSISQIFNLILYQPLLNLLIIFYLYLPGHDFGVAVIALTLVTKLMLYPLGNKAIKAQAALNELQPKIKEIQEKYKNDKVEQSRQMMEAYKQAKISPFTGFGPLFIQLPILIALFQVFSRGLNPESMSNLYSFVVRPDVINPSFLGIADLSKPAALLAVLAGIGQFWQTAMMTPKETKKKANKVGFDPSSMMQKQMQYLFPLMTVLILFKIPSAVALYWLVSIVFSIVQQYLLNKKYAQPG